jgi:hypothetical protein
VHTFRLCPNHETRNARERISKEKTPGYSTFQMQGGIHQKNNKRSSLKALRENSFFRAMYGILSWLASQMTHGNAIAHSSIPLRCFRLLVPSFGLLPRDHQLLGIDYEASSIYCNLSPAILPVLTTTTTYSRKLSQLMLAYDQIVDSGFRYAAIYSTIIDMLTFVTSFTQIFLVSRGFFLLSLNTLLAQQPTNFPRISIRRCPFPRFPQLPCLPPSTSLSTHNSSSSK